MPPAVAATRPAEWWPARRGAAVTGTVASFDAERGLGTVADEEGTELSFHCSAITDGTRQIDVGQPVTFVVRPTHRGLLEARAVQKR
jgi:cold shock CspA family protein